MAKISNGIFGPISGKIGGVVGGSWKGQNYVRTYVKPGASNTDAQIAQRDRFAYVVAAARPFVGRVFNTYYDKFLSKESGFNRYIRNNIPFAPDYEPINNHQVTDGPLHPGSALAATFNVGTTVVAIAWNVSPGVDGAGTDVAVGWARDRVTNQVIFGTDVTRTIGAMNITCPLFALANGIDVGVFFARVSGGVVQRISRNLSVSAVAA